MMLTDGGDGGHDLAELQLVEDGGLTGRIQPDHEDPHLLLAKEALEQASENVPHLEVVEVSVEKNRQFNPGGKK